MRNLSILCVVFVLVITHFTSAFKILNRIDADEQNGVKDHPKGFGTAKHAIIIGLDGFGGAFLQNVSYRYPALQSFFDFGAFTTQCRNVAPTVSAPNWGTYLTSMDVSQHGIYSNEWTAANGNSEEDTSYSVPPISGRGRPQTIFSVVKLHDQSLKTALMFTWEWFKEIAHQNSHVDTWFWGKEGIVCGKNESEPDCLNRQDWNVQKKTIEAIKNDKPTLTFVHFDAIDGAGHASWWGSDLYYEMVEEKEAQLAGILAALEETVSDSGKPMIEETMVVVVADHGGYRGQHGWTPPFIAEVFVPLLIRGPGVKNVNMEDFGRFADVSTLDMPVTVLNALGIEKGDFMRGRVLEDIYGEEMEHDAFEDIGLGRSEEFPNEDEVYSGWSDLVKWKASFV